MQIDALVGLTFFEVLAMAVSPIQTRLDNLAFGL